MKRGPDAPGFDPARDILFVGIGASAVCYYRCVLPATALGADWIGVSGDPSNLKWHTGSVQGQSGVVPDMANYKVIVFQQAVGPNWVKLFDHLRERGVKVVFEIDDYVHGLKHMTDEHAFAKHFTNHVLSQYEQSMRHADALITSTQWISDCYSHFQKRTYVCENGLDLKRYGLTRPSRNTVNIGWSGGTGHAKAFVKWAPPLLTLMHMRPNTTFISVGQRFADRFTQYVGPMRAISTPFTQIEQYPAAMSMFDIALAPTGDGGWWKGKSNLRFLEAGAMAIPTIADPLIYGVIEHEETGFLVASPEDFTETLMRLIDDGELRQQVGSQAQEFVRENYAIEKTSQQWVEVSRDLLEC